MLAFGLMSLVKYLMIRNKEEKHSRKLATSIILICSLDSRKQRNLSALIIENLRDWEASHTHLLRVLILSTSPLSAGKLRNLNAVVNHSVRSHILNTSVLSFLPYIIWKQGHSRNPPHYSYALFWTTQAVCILKITIFSGFPI